MSRRVSFSPDLVDRRPTPTPSPVFKRQGSSIGGAKKQPSVVGIWTFRPPKNSGFSALRFLERIGAKVARALRFVSSSSRKVSSSSSSSSSSSCSCSTLERSRSYAEAFDSHRAQAIEDCIEFLNSSSNPSSYSSFQRSKSVSTLSC